MKGPIHTYLVNILCGAGAVTVIVNGFVPMFGLSPFLFLAIFIAFPILTHLSERVAESERRDRRKLKESYERLTLKSHKRSEGCSCGLRRLNETLGIKEIDIISQRRKALPKTISEPDISTADCVLTDQIFEAARRKGIDPEDVIGSSRETEKYEGERC